MFVFSSGQRDAGEDMDEQYDFIKKKKRVRKSDVFGIK